MWIRSPSASRSSRPASCDRPQRVRSPGRSGVDAVPTIRSDPFRIDDTTYDRDVVVDRGNPEAKEEDPPGLHTDYGHTPLSIAEDIPWKCRRLVIGTGDSGSLPVMPEVEGKRLGGAESTSSRFRRPRRSASEQESMKDTNAIPAPDLLSHRTRRRGDCGLEVARCYQASCGLIAPQTIRSNDGDIIWVTARGMKHKSSPRGPELVERRTAYAGYRSSASGTRPPSRLIPGAVRRKGAAGRTACRRSAARAPLPAGGTRRASCWSSSCG